jgi:hypothetical protein
MKMRITVCSALLQAFYISRQRFDNTLSPMIHSRGSCAQMSYTCSVNATGFGLLRGGARRVPILAAMVTAVLAAGAARAQQSDETSMLGSTAEAKPAPLRLPDGTPERLDFTFGDAKSGGFTAWLRNKGGWYMEGWVHHTGLRCATYRVGVRFGAGKPGCSDVTWLTDVIYVTEQTQCNNASQQHAGGDINFSLGKDFARVTCAERVISCRGSCR